MSLNLYTVHYSKEGYAGVSGTMADQTFTVGMAQNLSPCGFTCSLNGINSFFGGWSTTKNGPVVFSDEQEVTDIAAGGETITLYAIWMAGYTVHFDANGGEGTMDDEVYGLYERKNLTNNAFTLDGYFFTCACPSTLT
jgi:hypothetical protein